MINEKDIRKTARLVDHIINDQAIREKIICRQSEQVTAFQPERVFPLYRKAIIEFARKPLYRVFPGY